MFDLVFSFGVERGTCLITFVPIFCEDYLLYRSWRGPWSVFLYAERSSLGVRAVHASSCCTLPKNGLNMTCLMVSEQIFQHVGNIVSESFNSIQ